MKSRVLSAGRQNSNYSVCLKVQRCCSCSKTSVHIPIWQSASGLQSHLQGSVFYHAHHLWPSSSTCISHSESLKCKRMLCGQNSIHCLCVVTISLPGSGTVSTQAIKNAFTCTLVLMLSTSRCPSPMLLVRIRTLVLQHIYLCLQVLVQQVQRILSNESKLKVPLHLSGVCHATNGLPFHWHSSVLKLASKVKMFMMTACYLFVHQEEQQPGYTVWKVHTKAKTLQLCDQHHCMTQHKFLISSHHQPPTSTSNVISIT